MTTSEIEAAANRGDLATADFQIQLVLRQQALPAFLEDVGRIGWRTRIATLTTVQGQQAYTLPTDYFEMDAVFVAGDLDPIPFIGEDPLLVVQAELQTLSGRPEGYYVTADEDEPTLRAIKFDAPCTGGLTVKIVYYWYVPFEDDDDVDLQIYIPEQYHWALVELLRREIIDDRFGQGDTRFATADKKYREWISRIATKRHLAPRGNRADYVR